MSENLEYGTDTTEEETAEPTGTIAAESVEDAEAVEAEATDGATLTEGEDDPGTPEEVIYYEIDGEEITQEEYRAMKRDAGDRKNFHADYSRKTKALADERNAFDNDRQALNGKLEMLTELQGEIEQVVMGDLATVDLDELLERGDTNEYLRVKKLREDRAGALSELAKKRENIRNEINAERYQALHNELGWEDETKHKEDMKLITGYAQRKKISKEDFATFLHPAIHQAFRDAEVAARLEESKPEIRKRVLKAPKGARPTGRKTPAKQKSHAEILYPTGT